MSSKRPPSLPIRRNGLYQWFLLTAVSLPFAWWGSTHRLAGDQSLGGSLVHRAALRASNLEEYIFAYKAGQMYGVAPEELDHEQRANVERACRCAAAINKCAAHGPSSLSDDECEMVVRSLPRQYPNLDEYPGYEQILRACRERLERTARHWDDGTYGTTGHD
jgi:hypothetical protein